MASKVDSSLSKLGSSEFHMENGDNYGANS